MNPTPVTTPFSLTRLAMTLTGVTALGAAAAGFACFFLDFQAQIPALTLTAGACLLASLFALLPLGWRAAVSPSGLAEGFMVGILLRMVLTGAAILALHVVTHIPTPSLGGWASAWYLLLLAVEVACLRGLEKKGATA